MEEALRGWLENLQQAGEEPEAGATARPEPPSEPPSPGIVPPNGLLPRRFGPPLWMFWGSRFGAILIGAAVATYNLRDVLGDERTILGLIIAGAVAVTIVAGWLRGRRNIEALSVTFEAAGIVVRTQLSARHLPWGNLVGLRPPDGVRTGWAIEANVDGHELLVKLPRGKAWTHEMVDALRGRSDHRDPRFERPRDDVSSVSPSASRFD